VDHVARVVLALDAPDVAEEVLHFLDRSGRARVVATAADDRQLAEAVRQCEPDAVVADPSLATSVSGAPILALATRESVGSLRAAVTAGAKGFFVWPGERDGLLDGVVRTVAIRRTPERRATVVAVHAARGGSGCTFLATHLAEAWRRTGSTCVLIDAELTYGDVACALGAVDGEARTLADLAPVADELAWDHLADVLVHGAVLAPPVGALDPVDADAVLKSVVEVAASAADVVVLDLPRALDERTVWCLREADRIVEVLTLDAFAFHALRRARETLSPLALDERRVVVVNRAARADLTPADVRRAFGDEPAAVIPADAAVARAQDQGRLLPPRGRTARAIDRLAGRLIPDADDGSLA
jgi:Flp pilus assembly CpaE family ATPase